LNTTNVNLIFRLLTAIVAAPVILGLLYVAPPWAFYCLVLAATAIGGHEFFRMTHPSDRVAQAVGVVMCLATSGAIYGFHTKPDILLVAMLMLPVCSVMLSLSRLGEIPSAALRLTASGFGPLYLAALTLLALMRKQHPDNIGAGLVLFSLMISWFADTAGYFAGRFLGKHKLYEAVSPKKTIEGSVGGLAGSLLAATLAHFTFLPSLPLLPGLALAAVAGALGQAGDLGESLLKRSTGIKDSGGILPGHGGILDRIDALLVSSTFVYLFSAFWMKH
jgi:phosphatidate cytidylyltransferase